VAGLGFKDFQVGEVLTSSDVDGYLMQQAVMRFADAAARGSALGTATGTAVPLAEGMVTYLDDANYMQVFDGTNWRDTSVGIGSNVVQGVKSDTFSASLASGAITTVTGLSATITPTSASSKVLVIVSIAVGAVGTEFFGPNVIVERGGTPIGVGDAASSRTRVTGGAAKGGSGTTVTVTCVVLDSPATTSATTYTVDIQNLTNGTNTMYVNRSKNDTNEARKGRAASSVTLIEVAA